MLGHTNVCLDLSSIIYYQLSLDDYHAKHGLRFAKTRTIRVNKDDRFSYAPDIAHDILDLLSAHTHTHTHTHTHADLKEHRENIYASRYIEDYVRLTLMKDIDIRIIS